MDLSIDIYRLRRATTQRIYVIKSEIVDNSDDDEIVLEVTSASSEGRTYSVSITPDDISCSCPDHVSRGGFCKHILNVLVKVLKFDPDVIIRDSKWVDEFTTAYTTFKNLLEARDSPDLPTIDNIRHDDECIICYEKLQQQQQHRLQQCATCKHVFHRDCIYEWSRYHANSCPMCRSSR